MLPPTLWGRDGGGGFAGRSEASCSGLDTVSLWIKEVANEKYLLSSKKSIFGGVHVDADALESGGRRQPRWSFEEVLQ